MGRPGNLAGGLVALSLSCLALGGLAGWMLRAPPPAPAGYVAQLKADLGLRPDQVAAIDAILAESDRDVDELLSRVRQSIQDEVARRLEDNEQAILAVLDQAQRDRYAQLLATEGR
jgi:hypothetical protein